MFNTSHIPTVCIDATLNEVIVVLKMLYLKDLRGLQDEINQLMMLCQDTTANP